jgi:hypothetical protein
LALCCVACGRQHASSSTAAATGATPGTAVATSTGAAPAAIAPATPAALSFNCLPTQDGYLRLRMRGDANLDIDWHDADMHCEGGPRPGQHGMRLTFAGPIPGPARGRAHGPRSGSANDAAHNLRFVFGIAASPGARDQHNVPTNVTVIFEGEHKLFSTAGDGKCTVDEFSEQTLPAQAESLPARPGSHAGLHLRRVAARGFCTAAASALAGNAHILLSRFDFAGPVTDEDANDAPPPATP